MFGGKVRSEEIAFEMTPGFVRTVAASHKGLESGDIRFGSGKDEADSFRIALVEEMRCFGLRLAQRSSGEGPGRIAAAVVMQVLAKLGDFTDYIGLESWRVKSFRRSQRAAVGFNRSAQRI